VVQDLLDGDPIELGFETTKESAERIAEGESASIHELEQQRGGELLAERAYLIERRWLRLPPVRDVREAPRALDQRLVAACHDDGHARHPLRENIDLNDGVDLRGESSCSGADGAVRVLGSGHRRGDWRGEARDQERE
jgi:hypothetical protein